MATIAKISNTSNGAALRDAVLNTVESYLDECGELKPTQLYQLILEAVEEPLLQLLMEKTHYNQCEVTRVLGLARGTVRKKLAQYGLLKKKRFTADR
ncbi:MAG: helix-turn-helix domain-containing protein [Gammaproteobacteria bacterium]